MQFCLKKHQQFDTAHHGVRLQNELCCISNNCKTTCFESLSICEHFYSPTAAAGRLYEINLIFFCGQKNIMHFYCQTILASIIIVKIFHRCDKKVIKKIQVIALNKAIEEVDGESDSYQKNY